MHIRTLGLLVLFLIAAPIAARAAEPDFDVTVFGNGRAFFMIPGLSSSMDIWDDAARRYGVQFRVHRFTLAGFAGVKPVNGDFIERSTAAIKAYAEKNDVHNAVVMGHSVGGIIALKLAAEAPERFNSVVVIDILPFLGGATFGANDAAQAAAITERYKKQMTAMTPADFLAQQKTQIPLLVSGTDNIDRLAQWIKGSDASTIIEATCELYANDFRPVLPKIRGPVLVIYPWDPGSNLPAATIDAIYLGQYAGLSHKALKRIDNSRHFVMLDQRDAFFRALDDFLSKPVRLGSQ